MKFVNRVAKSVQCPRQRRKNFPLASVSRQALGPSQPPVQWVPGGPFVGTKARPGRDADHSPPSSAEVENEWSGRHTPPPSAIMACSGTALAFSDEINFITTAKLPVKNDGKI
jgi:hypothetical protein